MHSRLYQLLLAFMRYMPVACMSRLVCCGLCCSSISTQYWPKNSSCGGPCLLPPLRKEVGGLCPSSTTISPSNTETRVVAGHVPVSRLKRLDRT